MEAGAPQPQSCVLESPAGLLPLVMVWEQAGGFAEGVLDFFVKFCQRGWVEVGGYHSHVVGDLADAGAVSQETEGDLGIFDAGDLVQELCGFLNLPPCVVFTELFITKSW